MKKSGGLYNSKGFLVDKSTDLPLEKTEEASNLLLPSLPDSLAQTRV